jgi:hypothetical protein
LKAFPQPIKSAVIISLLFPLNSCSHITTSGNFPPQEIVFLLRDFPEKNRNLRPHQHFLLIKQKFLLRFSPLFFSDIEKFSTRQIKFVLLAKPSHQVRPHAIAGKPQKR